MTYAEKLQDPRWQKRRLDVMQRADFQCEFCRNREMTLHVHHLKYTGEPWEAPDEDLECLCKIHHDAREKSRGNLECIFLGKGLRAEHARVLHNMLSVAWNDFFERFPQYKPKREEGLI